jgi:hypothetical protein
MGLFSSLVTLPLAPVRGAAWVVQQVAEEAERQVNVESQLRRELLQLELDHEAGLIDDTEYQHLSDALLDQIAQSHATDTAQEESSSGTERTHG